MHWIDILVCLVLLVAVWNGARRGLIMQVCSLVGIIVSIWAAARFGSAVGGWLHVDPAYGSIVGFGIVLVVGLIAVTVIGFVLRKIFHLAGLAMPDRLLGVVVASLKYLLVLSSIFAAFDYVNNDYVLVPQEKLDRSVCYRPMCSVARVLLPFVGRLSSEVREMADKATDEASGELLVPTDSLSDEQPIDLPSLETI